jgi:hypothetical protein
VIRLRGHHLICLHFFGGEGYGAEFRAALRGLLERAESGEAVEVVSGADDVCRRCPHLEAERCEYEEGADEEIRAMDEKALGLLGRRPGEDVEWHEIREAVLPVFGEWARSCCTGCTWKKACLKSPLWRALTRKGRSL